MAEALLRTEFEQHVRHAEKRWDEHKETHGAEGESLDRRLGRVNERLEDHDEAIDEFHDTSQYIRGALAAILTMMKILVGIIGLGATIATIYAVFK